MRPARDTALVVAVPLAGAAAGAASALSASMVHPGALPALVALAALAAASVARAEIGIAAAFALLPAGYLIGPDAAPWAVGTAWIGVVFAIALARWVTEAHERRTLPPPAATLIVLALVMLGGVIASGRVDPALPALRTVGTGLALAFAIATQVRTADQIRVILGGLSVATLMTGGYAAYQYLAGVDASAGFFTESGQLARRVSAGFGQPNQLGGILVVLLPFSIAGAILHRRAMPLHLAAVALGTYGVYVSFSRGALVALVAIPLVFARGRATLLIAPLVAAALALATPDLVRERFATLTEQGSEIATRLEFWRVAATVWSDAPLLGAGLGTFPDAYAAARVPGKEFLPTTIFEPPPHAHNLALHTLAEQGILGLTALVGVLLAAGRAALRLRRSPERWIRTAAAASLASLVALVVHNLVDVTLLEATAIVFWASLGLIAALHKASTAAADTDRSDAPVAS